MEGPGGLGRACSKDNLHGISRAYWKSKENELRGS